MPPEHSKPCAGNKPVITWPEDILKALDRALKRMPPIIRGMAWNRLKEDVEVHLRVVGRFHVQRGDILLVSRRMISGRMFENLERELSNGSPDGAHKSNPDA